MDLTPFALAILRHVEDSVNAQLARQYAQLSDSLQAFLYDLFNYPLERSWQASLSIFANHWEERGLRLSSGSLGAIARLIEERIEDLPEEMTRVNQLFDTTTVSATTPILAMMARGPSKGSRRRATAARKATAPKPRLPAEGVWITGKRGEGTLKLAQPIRLSDGQIVTSVEYLNGRPIYDKWQLPGDEVIIAITGDHKFDAAEAAKAWKQQTGQPLKPGYTFHHDGNVVELGTFKGKKVFVARMQPIPTELNKLPHISRAQAAREYLLDPAIARLVNKLGREGKGPLGRLGKTIRARLAKRAQSIGRTLRLGKTIPIVGGILTLYFFAEDVEAHGVGGAIVRATPLLGDIVSLYDLGSDLAEHIENEAKKTIDDAVESANAPIARAHARARRATEGAFKEIAGNLRVTKAYIQPEEIIEALKEPLGQFYQEAFYIYFQLEHQRTVPYPADSSSAEQRGTSAIDLRLHKAKAALKIELEDRLQEERPQIETH